MYNEYNALTKRVKAINLGDYLEFGCGDGGFLKYVLDQNGSFTSISAVDINPEAVKKARTTLESFNIHFEIEENLPLDIQSNRFDTITLSNTLHHLEDKPSVLNELKRLIKKEGRIIILEMISNDLTEAEQTYCRFHALRAKVDRLHGVYHETTYASHEIVEMVLEAGLKIEFQEIILNSKESLPNKTEIAEMATTLDELIQAESERLGFLSLEAAARDIKAHLRKYGIKRPRQLYLEITTP